MQYVDQVVRGVEGVGGRWVRGRGGGGCVEGVVEVEGGVEVASYSMSDVDMIMMMMMMMIM